MNFRIYRTSYEFSDDTPIDGAILENPSRGYYEEPTFTIEIETLEDLIALMKRAGHPLILCRDYEKRLSLEIYDDYRE